jgi:uncharacterized protein YbjQ (UPF0145 family)
LSDTKKDLTRIEDLAEYLHELHQEEEVTDFQSGSDQLPDLPADEEEGPFSMDSTESTEQFSSSFSTEETTDFSGAEFNSEDNSFSSNDEASDFGSEFNSESSFETISFNDNSFEGNTSDTEDEIKTEADTDESSLDFEGKENSEEEDDTDFTSSFSDDELLAEDENFTSTTTEEMPLDEAVTTSFNTPTLSSPVSEVFKAPENFNDIKKFAENSSFTGMGAEGNPSFSVLIKDVRYIEDVNDILGMLKELELLSDSEEQVRSRLMRGQLLVPRISEYAAIFLAHKLRRFDIDIQIGLSDEIHPPKHGETPETGIVSKNSLYQNKAHHFNFSDVKLQLSQIMISATPGLEGHQVVRYVGIASEHKILERQIVENESSDEIPRHYDDLAQKLKAHALKAKANAVVGLNYQLTPIPSEFGLAENKYRLSCTGNMVWVNKV